MPSSKRAVFKYIYVDIRARDSSGDVGTPPADRDFTFAVALPGRPVNRRNVSRLEISKIHFRPNRYGQFFDSYILRPSDKKTLDNVDDVIIRTGTHSGYTPHYTERRRSSLFAFTTGCVSTNRLESRVPIIYYRPLTSARSDEFPKYKI